MEETKAPEKIEPTIEQGATTDTPEVKTFTQEQVNSIVSEQKQRMKKNMLDVSELGLSSTQEGRLIIENARKQEEANKTELERVTEEKISIEKQLQTLKKRTQVAEAGATGTNIKAVTSLASVYMDEDGDLDFKGAIEKVKEEHGFLFRTNTSSVGVAKTQQETGTKSEAEAHFDSLMK